MMISAVVCDRAFCFGVCFLFLVLFCFVLFCFFYILFFFLGFSWLLFAFFSCWHVLCLMILWPLFARKGRNKQIDRQIDR